MHIAHDSFCQDTDMMLQKEMQMTQHYGGHNHLTAASFAGPFIQDPGKCIKGS
jgi:hypothetical protein